MVYTTLSLSDGCISSGKSTSPGFTSSFWPLSDPLFIVFNVGDSNRRIDSYISTNLGLSIKSLIQMISLCTLCNSFGIVFFSESLKHFIPHILDYDLALIGHLAPHFHQLLLLSLQEAVQVLINFILFVLKKLIHCGLEDILFEFIVANDLGVLIDVKLLHLALLLDFEQMQLHGLHLVDKLILHLHLLLQQLPSLGVNVPVNLVELAHHIVALFVLIDVVVTKNVWILTNWAMSA